MSLLRNLYPLLDRYQAKERRYQSLIWLLEQEKFQLNNEKLGLSNQKEILSKAIKSHCFENVNCRSELFQEQRKISVLRRRLLYLEQQIIQLNESMQKLQKKIVEVNELRRLVMKLFNKYKLLTSREIKLQRIKQELQNESETEELLLWKQ